MAVNLSPYGGVGAQFLDNSGNVLTGGKIFTYAGGTTTPQASYTSSNGLTPHPNPIILDAAGRVPGGEIWITDGLVYKFILRDANDVLIATYDGITGINSNFVNFTNQQEIQTATAGQTIFDLTTMSYQPGTNSLSVFVDGVNQYGPGAQYAYLETDSDTVTFLSGLHVGAEVKFTTSQLNSSASSNDAEQVSYSPPFTGAISTNVEVKLSQTISVQDFGVLPGAAYAITNCNNYANLAAYVNSIGGNCQIVWPSADDPYEFTPYLNATYNSTPNLWRGVVELVDVKNCYHVGYGATAKFNMNPTWYRGNPNVASLDESVFQFRASTAQGDCDHVGVKGLRIEATATLPAAGGLGYLDGTAMGVIYRGCTNTLTENVTCYLWGTDGLYFGTAYSNAFGGYGHTVINPVMIANYRQGISIVQNNDGTIIGGEIRDTNGSSFGHGIDWEPDGSNTQTNWTVINIKTRNNQRGAFNFINTSNVRIINADVDERAATAVGAIYIDGSNIVGYNVSEIVFDGGSYVASQAVLYISGGAAVDGGITNIRFINGAYLSSVAAVLNNSAFLRLNPFGTMPGYLGDFYVENCVIEGNGGVFLTSGSIGTAKLFMKDTQWTLKNVAATALSFTMTANSAEIHLDGVEMSIDPANTRATYIMGADWRAGSVKNCTLSGQAAAILEWRDWYVGGTLKIGYNKFSTYSFYNGVVNALDLTFPGAVELDQFSGDFGAPFRIVHGGRQRVIAYVANPSAFIGQQAPQDGDITFNVGNSATSTVNQIFVFDDTVGWRQMGSQVRVGTTPNRPSVTGLPAAETGLMYLDTTLAADGKPVWWNGSAWVDATGTVV